jgi:hypothetical protein
MNHVPLHSREEAMVKAVIQEADALMAGDCANISGDLTAAMMKWKAVAQ